MLHFSLFLILIPFGNTLSHHCPKTITITSKRVQTTTNNKGWKNKVGRYYFRNYENGHAVYENIRLRGIYLYQSKGGNWVVGDKLDFGWIANTKCKSECPTACPKGSWIYWRGRTGGEGAWKPDSTLMVFDSDAMQSDQPQLRNEVMETYRAGHPHSTCTQVLSKTYQTYEKASNVCSKDQQCSFVLDEGCDDKGEYKLCTPMSLIQESSTDCIFTIKF